MVFEKWVASRNGAWCCMLWRLMLWCLVVVVGSLWDISYGFIHVLPSWVPADDGRIGPIVRSKCMRVCCCSRNPTMTASKDSFEAQPDAIQYWPRVHFPLSTACWRVKMICCLSWLLLRLCTGWIISTHELRRTPWSIAPLRCYLALVLLGHMIPEVRSTAGYDIDRASNEAHIPRHGNHQPRTAPHFYILWANKWRLTQYWVQSNHSIVSGHYICKALPTAALRRTRDGDLGAEMSAPTSPIAKKSGNQENQQEHIPFASRNYL